MDILTILLYVLGLLALLVVGMATTSRTYLPSAIGEIKWISIGAATFTGNDVIFAFNVPYKCQLEELQVFKASESALTSGDVDLKDDGATALTAVLDISAVADDVVTNATHTNHEFAAASKITIELAGFAGTNVVLGFFLALRVDV